MAATSENANITGVTPNGTTWVCEHLIKFERSKGIFLQDNPFSYTLPVLFLQTSLASLFTAILQFVLAPLGQSSFVPQMLAGLILGPSFLGESEFIRKWLFPPRTFYISETISFYGCMLFLFLIGVKIDLVLIQKLFLTPDQVIYETIFPIVLMLSTGSFHVTAIHLADLKLLNSEMGRIAISASMVSGSTSLLLITTIVTQKQGTLMKDSSNVNWMTICLLAMIAFTICVLRPIMLWMVIGEHFTLGPVILGLAVPDGPPLGSALTERLETMVSKIFLPLYFLFCGASFKLFLIDSRCFVTVQIIAVFAFLGKVGGTMLPSIYLKMPLTDVLSLGLLMSCQGITQLLYLQTSIALEFLDQETYGSGLIALVWVTGLITPIVKFLYDPSKRYLSLNKRRTIEQSASDIELRLMACVHDQENIPSMINLLEMSNPSLRSPICFYVLHLIQLAGRSTPLFIDHQPIYGKTKSSHSSYSRRIINAFRSYEQQKENSVVVKIFTSISPYETMHDEICMQVAEKRVCLLIVPFHRQWRPNGITESAHPVRALNRQLLRTAPCSVGILIERGALNRNNPLTSVSFYSVGVVFIEGEDDREALAYAMRMANQPNVSVTMVRIMEPRKKNKNMTNRDPNGDLIHRFKVDCIQIKRHDYKEEIARDSVEMINVIKSLEGCFDLILVGRRHECESGLFNGLSEWNEYPELGPMGDMLVASDSTFDGSVLVVQQQKRSGTGYHDLHLDSGFVTRQESLTIVEVPHDRKVWPMV
ncbi:cation/H(+) antiporter 15 [Medicago truncatula]|uniref:cation/H(+) antiporter 15 n=1 Tax=Medicago truncatula TaxID=3880 RepID=UPI0019680E17|nr:cation/H(+) antiporter 15 [Medicago truncatula]